MARVLHALHWQLLRHVLLFFRVAEGNVKGILSMAVGRGFIHGTEAQAILRSVHAKGSRHTEPQSISTNFVIDLTLAITDSAAA